MIEICHLVVNSGAALQEEDGGVAAADAGGQVQRRPAAAGAGVDVGAPRTGQQCGHHAGLLVAGGQVQRRVTRAVAPVRIGAVPACVARDRPFNGIPDTRDFFLLEGKSACSKKNTNTRFELTLMEKNREVSQENSGDYKWNFKYFSNTLK